MTQRLNHPWPGTITSTSTNQSSMATDSCLKSRQLLTHVSGSFWCHRKCPHELPPPRFAEPHVTSACQTSFSEHMVPKRLFDSWHTLPAGAGMCFYFVTKSSVVQMWSPPPSSSRVAKQQEAEQPPRGALNLLWTRLMLPSLPLVTPAAGLIDFVINRAETLVEFRLVSILWALLTPECPYRYKNK